MPTIKFQVPVGFQQGNPHLFFQQNGFLGRGNDKLGVYIWGVKLNIEGVIIFCPIYVGEGWLRNCLQLRHYNRNVNYGSHRKELFDLAILQANHVDFYTRVLQQYNALYMNFYPNNGGAIQNAMLIALINDLVYFQSQNHMNWFCHGVNHPQVALNHTHGEAFANYNALCVAGNGNACNLSNTMVAAKNTIACNFYFIYATLEDIRNENPNDFNHLTNDQLKQDVEHATKRALEKVNIYTVGKGVGEFPRMNINLTAIQNDLINVGGFVGVPNKYPNGYSNVGDPDLIIPVQYLPPHY